MILTITYMVVAVLHRTEPTIVATFKPVTVQGIQLEQAHPTIVKTWKVQ